MKPVKTSSRRRPKVKTAAKASGLISVLAVLVPSVVEVIKAFKKP